MTNTKLNLSSIRLVSFIFFSILVFNTLGRSGPQHYKGAASMTMEATLYISFFLLAYAMMKMKGFAGSYMYIYIGFILLSGIYLTNHIYYGNFEVNQKLFFLFCIFAFILAVMKISWTPAHLNIFGHIANIAVIYFLFHWVGHGNISYMYSGIYDNPNIFANILFALLYFQVVNVQNNPIFVKMYFLIGILVNLLLIFVATSRNVWLSLIVIVGAFIVLHFSRKIFSKIFYLVLSGNFLFLFVYVYLSKTSYAPVINDFFLRLTDKPLYSGRERFWGEVFDFGLTSPLLGHRVGIPLEEYMPHINIYHVHNQYLQVFVESGFLGLFAFILLLYFIWKSYQVNLDCHYVQWSACFFLGLLVYQNFEISMFSNMLAIGLIQWLGISVGISKALHHAPAAEGVVRPLAGKSGTLSSKI
ncbi:O-antigen ligase family protein [Bacillus massilinigeriensis]|uniref:O-antigen ligase family protein n=1 Tax=Bacillus mediterraneensis TaxID=1805474 RepID=UPI0008F96054|nr:O-antigen ligase family protein [Bacillus mediterraneensis]